MARLSIVILLVLASPLLALGDEARGKAIHDATLLVDAGKFDEAIAALKKLAADDPSDVLAAYELGLAYAAKGDSARCRATLEPIAGATGPVGIQILGMLGNCLDQVGEHEKAIQIYRRGLQSAPDDSILLFNLAVTLVQAQKIDEGVELLKHDVEKNAWHASAHLALAQLFEAQNFQFPALMSYLHFLALEPASTRAANASAHAMKLLNAGVQKTKQGANITYDPNARKEEGDYTGMQLMTGIVAAGKLAEETKASDFEKAQTQIGQIIAIFLEIADDKHIDFTARVQRPFFESMQKAGVIDAFAAVALGPQKLPGTPEWSKKNEKAVSAYFDWIRPQLRRPVVALPPK